MKVTREQAIAYKEVMEVLNHMSEEDINKIPKEVLKYYEENQDTSYYFFIDSDKSFVEQNLSDKAKIVLAILFRDYWASEEQREKIKRKEKADIEALEQKKKEIYQNENLFEKNKEVHPKEEQSLVVLEKEKWYTHFINFMKRIFSKRNK